MTPERFKKISNVLDCRHHDMTVVTDEVHKPRNLAAIMRSCDAVGIDTVHCIMPKTGYQIYGGTAASAEKWVNVEHHSDITTSLENLKNKGFQVVAAHLCEEAVEYREVDYTLPTALVLGAEKKGVSAEAQAYVDKNIVIPMNGMVESFNVSVACAIILMEARHQRECAGMYETRRLPEELYKKRFFCWAHPVLAEYCDKNSIEYPAVDDEGEVIDLPGWYKKVSKP